MKKYNKQLIKLKPNRVYRPFLGGLSIDVWEGKEQQVDGHFGERWIASLVNARNDGDPSLEGLSVIEDKEEQTLKSMVELNPVGMLGQAHVDSYGTSLAILVKALDAYSRLLIQVHPDKARAKELFDSEYGKTEAWYIIGTRVIDDVEPFILLGFKEGVTREWYEEQFHKQDIEALENCMHRIKVQVGDLYIIPGGTPHALGSGCFLIEIQEPTDFTIRSEVLAASGEPLAEALIHQGLGFKRMFECYDYTSHDEAALLSNYKLEPRVLSSLDGNVEIALIDEAFFSMTKRVITSTMKIQRQGAFEILLILKGEGLLVDDGEVIKVQQGDEFFMPHGVKSVEVRNLASTSMEVISCLPPKAFSK